VSREYSIHSVLSERRCQVTIYSLALSLVLRDNLQNTKLFVLSEASTYISELFPNVMVCHL
jgi:hypothetical protein